jgi:hypothetical protein
MRPDIAVAYQRALEHVDGHALARDGYAWLT